MISKKLTSALSCNGQIMFKRLDATIKCITRSSSNGALYHIYKNSGSNVKHNDRFLVAHGTQRQLHTSIANCNYFALLTKHGHSVLLGSDAHSNCLTATLSPKEDVENIDVEALVEKPWISMSTAEFVENFELLSHYAHKNEVSITDPRYQGVFEVLVSRCADFKDAELQHLFDCMTLWRIGLEDRALFYDKVFRFLDAQCVTRIPNWSVEELLKVNDQFYRLQVSRKSDFSWHSLRKLVNRRLAQLSPANLVQTAFLIKVNRKIPMNSYNFEYEVEKYADKYTIDEIAVIATAFMKVQVAIKSKDFMLICLQKLNACIDTINDVSLSAILPFLRHFDYEPVQKEFENLFKSLEPQVEQRPLPVLVHMLNLQRKVQFCNHDLIAKILDKYTREIKTAPIKFIENVVYFLTTFNYDPETTPFYSIVVEELLDPRRAEELERFPESLVEITFFMLQSNYFPEEIVKHIMDPEFITALSKGDVYNLRYQYLQIDYFIEIEHPDYKGPRVSKDIMDILVKRFGAVRPEVIRRTLKTQMSLRMTEDVLDACKRVLPPSAVHIDSPLPHFAKNNVIVCRDPETKEFVAPEPQLSLLPVGTIKRAPNDGKKWYVFVVGSKNLMLLNTGRPVGLLTTHIRQLERIGYTPILVPYYDWNPLADDDAKDKYIKDALSE